MEGLRNVSLHFDSTLPQIQNGGSLGDHVQNMSDVKPAMSEVKELGFSLRLGKYLFSCPILFYRCDRISTDLIDIKSFT